MKLYYFLIVKGDEEQAAATLDMRRKYLPEMEIIELKEYGYCQTQAHVTFEADTEYDVHSLEGVLNGWLTEDIVAPYPLGSLLFWHGDPDIGGTRKDAEARGMHTFDTALPQGWCDAVREKLGDPHLWLMGNIVWCYDEPWVWGEPRATTKMGDEILARVEAAYRNA